MSSAPFIPDSAPFTAEQRAWLNGFFAGVFSRNSAPGISNLKPGISDSGSSAAALQPLTILWGSQTGGCEALAKRAAKEAGKHGFAATLLDMAGVDVGRLATEANVLVITSTYGDGEPPDNARALHAALRAEGGASLPGVRFSVCALGDSNYTHFCRCGRDFDAYLEKRGATRIAPRADCDLDHETTFAAWLSAALGGFRGRDASPRHPGEPSENGGTNTGGLGEISPPSGYTRARPFPAPLLTVRRLNGVTSAKEVNHVEFSLDGSGLAYEAGDALGVYPHNCPELVQDVLSALGCDGEEAIASPGGDGDIPLRRALSEFYDLGKPTAELLEVTGRPAGDHHVIDVLTGTGGIALKPAELVARLKRLQPRL